MKNNIDIAAERVKSLSANFNYQERNIDSMLEYIDSVQNYKEELFNSKNYVGLSPEETDKYLSNVSRFSRT